MLNFPMTQQIRGGTVYNPDYDPTPLVGEDLGNRCYDLTVEVGGAYDFEINNIPNGDARTPGYWKNWNTCAHPDQADQRRLVADRNEFYLLDDVISSTPPEQEAPTNPILIGTLEIKDQDITTSETSGKGKNKENYYNSYPHSQHVKLRYRFWIAVVLLRVKSKVVVYSGVLHHT